MHRRSFIKNIAIALPAISLADMLLSSCRPKNHTQPDNKKLRVGIIGAGVSGLNSALLLNNYNKYEIEVLEASDRIGGRVFSEDKDAISSRPLELGADLIYGNDNSWYDIAKAFNLVDTNLSATNSYVNDAQVILESQFQSNSDFNSAKDAIQSALNYNQSMDVTFEQFMLSKGVPETTRLIYKNNIESLIGSSIDVVSIKGSIVDGLVKANSGKFTSDGKAFSDIVKLRYGAILPKVLTSCPVDSIDYSSNEILVQTALGIRRYDRLIITVPLSILKAGDIAFTPTLPQSKKDAMSLMDTGAGVKIILKLNGKFWPDGATNLYTDIEGIGMFRISAENIATGSYLLSTLVKGTDAEVLSNMSDDNIIQKIKLGLDKGLPSSGASGKIVASKVVRWSKMPYSKGTVSYLKVGGSLSNRQELARSVEDKLFFAGEATNYEGKSGTVHGAMETSIKAVNEVVKSFS